MTVGRSALLGGVSVALGVCTIGVGRFTGGPQLATLGSGLVVLGVVSALLRPGRTARVKDQLAAQNVSAWLLFTLGTLIGGVLAIVAGIASIQTSGLELAIVLLPLGTVCLASAGPSLRYAVRLSSWSGAVRAFGVAAFGEYYKYRRAKRWDADAMAKELGHSAKWIIAAQRRYEGSESLRRSSHGGSKNG